MKNAKPITLSTKEEDLRTKSEEELLKMLSLEKTTPDRTEEERAKNIETLTVAINGGACAYRDKELREDIKAGEADTSDMGGIYA